MVLIETGHENEAGFNKFRNRVSKCYKKQRTDFKLFTIQKGHQY